MIDRNISWKYNNFIQSFKEGRDFNVSVAFLKERYNVFNKSYFNNQLPSASSFDFKITFESNINGLTRICYREEQNSLYVQLEFISISNFYKRTRKEYCSILLHEMIHVYQAFVLRKVKLLHDDSFSSKMDEINSISDWNITINTTRKMSSRIYGTTAAVLHDSLLTAIKLNKTDDYGLFVIPLKEKSKVEKFFPNAKFYRILDPQEFKLYDYINDVEYPLSEKSPVKITLVQKDNLEISNMIKNFKIEELPKNEKIEGVRCSRLVEIKTNEDNVEKEGRDEYGCYYCISKKKVLPDGSTTWSVTVE